MCTCRAFRNGILRGAAVVRSILRGGDRPTTAFRLAIKPTTAPRSETSQKAYTCWSAKADLAVRSESVGKAAVTCCSQKKQIERWFSYPTNTHSRPSAAIHHPVDPAAGFSGGGGAAIFGRQATGK